MESLEICRTFQEDLKGILFDGSNLESEDAELYDYISSLKNPKDILVHSSNLKEEGNSSFKGGDLDGALEKYSLSMVFLSCLDLNETGVRISFSQLATSVVLNMAASFLKKKEFGNVGHFCSIVLNHNPDNVKALFRRANAAIGLGNYELASWDLKVAHDVEPSNQEVMRKLREVEQILNSLPEKNHGQGKKEGEMSLGEGNEIEQCEMMDVETDNKSNSVKEVGSTKGRPKEKEVALSEGGNDKEMLDVGSGNATKVGGSAPKVTKTKYHFRNRRKPGSALVISKDDYLLLAKGKTIQHFNLRSGTTMSIKAIGTPRKLPGKNSKNRTQHFPSSPPIQQDENMDPKVSIDNVSHGEPCQSEDNSVMEISPPCPEEVKKSQPADANETLPSSHINPFDESPTCFPAVVASSCIFSSFSITTGIRSPTRRAQSRALKRGAQRSRRFNHKNLALIQSNQGCHCRYNMGRIVKHDDHHLAQRLSSHRSGMKRKSISYDYPDLSHQPKKLLIIMNETGNSYSRSSVCNFALQTDVVMMAKNSASG
ncbi:Peptidyl-prolyl cis-trans isomerase D [Bienertia sinuspersici]